MKNLTPVYKRASDFFVIGSSELYRTVLMAPKL